MYRTGKHQKLNLCLTKMPATVLSISAPECLTALGRCECLRVTLLRSCQVPGDIASKAQVVT
jgi:hypothetical protein